jgi:hypothetical protein
LSIAGFDSLLSLRINRSGAGGEILNFRLLALLFLIITTLLVGITLAFFTMNFFGRFVHRMLRNFVFAMSQNL